MADFDEIVAFIRAYGPQRVVVNIDGDALSSRRAREVFGITPDVIHVRGDGWSIGAPERFARIAESMWPDAWIAVLRRPFDKAEPYTRRGGHHG